MSCMMLQNAGCKMANSKTAKQCIVNWSFINNHFAKRWFNVMYDVMISSKGGIAKGGY